MLNLINNENDAVFDEICKKKAKIKTKFQKINGTFLNSIRWLKSPQPPLIHFVSKIQKYWDKKRTPFNVDNCPKRNYS